MRVAVLLTADVHQAQLHHFVFEDFWSDEDLPDGGRKKVAQWLASLGGHEGGPPGFDGLSIDEVTAGAAEEVSSAAPASDDGSRSEEA